MLISEKNTLKEIPRTMFDQISGHPVAQSSWHMKLTITAVFSHRPLLWESNRITNVVALCKTIKYLAIGLEPLCRIMHDYFIILNLFHSYVLGILIFLYNDPFVLLVFLFPMSPSLTSTLLASILAGSSLLECPHLPFFYLVRGLSCPFPTGGQTGEKGRKGNVEPLGLTVATQLWCWVSWVPHALRLSRGTLHLNTQDSLWRPGWTHEWESYPVFKSEVYT